MIPDDAPALPAAVVFCPHPPLMLPALEGQAAPETDRLRQACSVALAAALSTDPDVVVVVGEGPPGVRYGVGDAGDLAPYGGSGLQPFSGRAHPGDRRLPLPHMIAGWLLDEAAHTGTRLGVAPGDLTATLDDLTGSVVVVAMGDGSARRTEKAPGHLDPGVAGFDARVATALAEGDATALATLDPAEGDRLLAAGTASWRAVGRALTGSSWTPRLLHDAAPYGVGYLVAHWTVGGAATSV